MGDSVFMYPPEPKWNVTWLGDTYTAPTAYEVLQEIGECSYAPLDHKYPKRGIAYRVFVQFRILIDDQLPDEQFLTRLAEYGLMKVEVTGTPPNDILTEAVNFAESWYGVSDQVETDKE